MSKIKIHTTFNHNSGDDEFNWDGFDDHGRFVAGEEVDVPEGAADYFNRAGWASDPGEDPVQPDPSKPVLVNPDYSTLGTK